MLPYVLFDFEPFGDDAKSLERHRLDLCWLLESLTQRNETYLGDHPDTPLLYSAPIKYIRPAQVDGGQVAEIAALKRVIDRDRLGNDPEAQAALETVTAAVGGERFRDIPRIIENGGGDCDNVAAWRCAELRQAGIKAAPFVTWRKRTDGGTTMHATVQWPAMKGVAEVDGVPQPTIEDPSLILGMGGDDRADDRAEEWRKNDERRGIMAARVQACVQAGKMTPDEGRDAIATLIRLLPPRTKQGASVVGGANVWLRRHALPAYYTPRRVA